MPCSRIKSLSKYVHWIKIENILQFNKFIAGLIGSPLMNFFQGKIVKKDGYWFQNQGLKIKIPESKYNKIEKFIDLKIILGIHPED